MQSTDHVQHFDTVVIGAGMGGLMTAALIRKRFPNWSLAVLESHTVSGGCASYFDRRLDVGGLGEKSRFRFDVGATTLSGVEPGQPMALLLEELGLTLPLHHAKIGVRVVLADGTEVLRHADRATWRAESAQVFGAATVPFWHEVESLASEVWGMLGGVMRFPPTSLADVISLARPSVLTRVGLAPKLFQPLSLLMEKHGLSGNARFRAFVDQQLLISSQNASSDTPLLLGTLALDYPSETYYVDGGMFTLAQHLEHFIRESGATVRHKRRVTSIAKSAGGFEIETKRGERYHARRIIANMTLWDLPTLIGEESLQRWTRKHTSDSAPAAWGATDLYGALRDTIDDKGPIYHQIHETDDDGHPYSVFLSLSRAGDEAKAPVGWRTFSCSTHEANPERWFSMTKDEEAQERVRMRRRIERALEKHLPGYLGSEKAVLELSTPYHYHFYTRRGFGRVGGVPHSLKRPLIFWPGNRTPVRDLFVVGDTVFPGQGMPAIAHGARCLVGRL